MALATRPGVRQSLVLLVGVGVLAGTTVAGQGDVLMRFLEPPFWAALPLAVAACLVGFVLALRSAERLRGSAGDPRSLIRGVRLVFLAVAAFAAAGGWLLGSAMPVVVGLVIGAVDVIETTALLLVTRPDDEAARGAGPAVGAGPARGAGPAGWCRARAVGAGPAVAAGPARGAGPAGWCRARGGPAPASGRWPMAAPDVGGQMTHARPTGSDDARRGHPKPGSWRD